jgi:excisionase family DNA binding protein
MVAMTEDRILTVEEAAERLRLSAWTVRDWLRRGKLKGIKMGNTRAGYRIRESEIERFLREGQMED